MIDMEGVSWFFVASHANWKEKSGRKAAQREEVAFSC